MLSTPRTLSNTASSLSKSNRVYETGWADQGEGQQQERESTYEALRRWGEMGNDGNNIVSMMLEFYGKHHHKDKK